MKKIGKEILKIIITGFLFFLIFKKVNFQDVKTNFLLLRKGYIFLSFSLFYIYYLFFALRWSFLLNKSGIKINILKAYAYIIISFFYNNFLPSAIGQDFVRSLYASRNEFSKALGVSFMDRFFGFVGMLILGLFSIFSSINNIRLLSIVYFLLIIFLFFLFFILTKENILKIKIKNQIFKIKFLNLGEELRKFYNALKDFKDKYNVIIIGIIISIFVQIIITLINFSLFKCVDLKISFYNLIVILPIVTVLSLIPFTVNGLGIREYAYIYFFGLIGIKNKDALSISLLYFILSVFASLIGGVLFLFLKRNK